MKTQAPRPGSKSQDEWLRLLEEMGGRFWPPEEEEEDMPEVGAKYPMMLYDGERECIVYDVEERAEAEKNGFHAHPSMEPSKPDKPLMAPVVKHAPYLSQKGELLSCTMGEWTGEPQTYHYQFRRDVNTILSTDSNEYNEYVLTPADAGHSIDCKLEAINAAGSAFSVSNRVAVPASKQGMPPPIPKPEVKTTVTVQKTVEVKKPAAPATPPSSKKGV